MVETSPPPAPSDTSWESLRDPLIADRFYELLSPTPVAAADAMLDDVAATLGSQATPRAAVEAAVDWVGGALLYERGATGVQTTALEALQGGRGVCQDFAHLTLALLRSMDVPCRYASGYVLPDGASAVGEVVAGQSHAWVEVWTGDWWGIDPTNGVLAGEHHVLVGRGRDYSDVAPFKGVYTGGSSTEVTVEVELTRMA